MAEGWGRGTWGSGLWGEGATAGILLTGLSTTFALGSVAFSIGGSVELTEVHATGEAGSVFVSYSISLTGVSTQAVLAGVLIWGPIQPDVPGNWMPVSGGPGGGWVPVDVGSADNWTPVAT